MARKTSPLSFRVDDRLRAALETAAAKDHRSVSSLVTKILHDWTEQNGHFDGMPETVEAVIASKWKYALLPGRPRKIPDPSNDWLDRQAKLKLDATRDYDIEAVCHAITGKSLADNVQYFDKGLENALLRNGWIEVMNVETNQQVWITRDQLTAPAVSP